MDHTLGMLKKELDKVESSIKQAEEEIDNTEKYLESKKKSLKQNEELAYEIREAIGLIEDQKDYL